MVKSEPLTAGLSERAKDWIEKEARRTGRSREAIIETLAEEAARTRLFPGIAFRGPADDRRAWLPGSGYDVWEAIEAYKGIGKERLLEERDFPERCWNWRLPTTKPIPRKSMPLSPPTTCPART